jgi:hypothetical protein
MKQTSHHRDTEALRTEKKMPFLCASVSLWLMQSVFSRVLSPWATRCRPFRGLNLYGSVFPQPVKPASIKACPHSAFWPVTRWQPSDSKRSTKFRVTDYSIRHRRWQCCLLPTAYCPLFNACLSARMNSGLVPQQPPRKFAPAASKAGAWRVKASGAVW